MLVMLANLQKVDLNCMDGWGLRRAVRFNQPKVWKYLLAQESVNVNIESETGMSALHMACKFNIFEAVTDLLNHPDIQLNNKSRFEMGSSPTMIAVKYLSRQAFEALGSDKRIDLETVDNQNRRLEHVIGITADKVEENEKKLIAIYLDKERIVRKWQKDRLEKLKKKENTYHEKHRKVKVVSVSGILETNPSEQSTFKMSESVVDEGYCSGDCKINADGRKTRSLW